jgi:formylglycine-generating enzyme required for sulfatase activity
MKGLEGAADRDGDGQVDVEELATFTKKHVAKFVDDTRGREQYPELFNRTRGTVGIVTLGRSRADAPKSITNKVGMKLVLIPAGEFMMGSEDGDDDEKPRHRVRITRPFYLGATEVTQGQYQAVTGENPSRFKGSDDLPVETVRWNEAVAFCNKLSQKEGLKPYYQFGDGEQSGGNGYRLPTEAEWEYACRAGSSSRYAFGDDESSLGDYAWFNGNSAAKTHPVGQKKPNAWGLFDMHGNVWEWCWDGYDEKYYSDSPSADPSGSLKASVRVFRSGDGGLSVL